MSTAGSPAAQTGLFGSPAAARAPLHRLFFALWPDAATRHEINHVAALLQLAHPGLRARWVRPERFHATLNFLGDFSVVPDEVLVKAMAAAGGVRSAAFTWTLDYVASFRGREPPCVLRGAVVPEALLALWRNMQAGLQETGLQLRSERQFTPHVTLAYARHALPAPTPVTPVVWQARRFALVHSLVGQGSYQVLGSWELGHGPQVT